MDKADRLLVSRQLPPHTAPKGVPVLVAGGVAMKKTGGEWFTGMEEPLFTKKLTWEPEWWATIPESNEPLPDVAYQVIEGRLRAIEIGG